MSSPSTTPEQRYATLVEALLPDARAKVFNAHSMCVNNKIFVMLVKDRLVVKLPRKRVDALVASGEGEPYDVGTGKPMKEWLVVVSDENWLPLAKEALEFMASK